MNLKKHITTFRKRITRKHIIISSIAIFFALLFSSAIFSAVVILDLKKTADTARIHASSAYDALKNQDLNGTKLALNELSQDVDSVKRQYAKLSFWRFSPLSWHYQDGVRMVRSTEIAVASGHLLVDSIEPYADVIGFQGQGSFVGGTAEDRIVKIMETLDKISPALDELISNIQAIEHEINGINPKRYPFEVSGQSVEDLIASVKTTLRESVHIMSDYQPLLAVLPEIAGVNEPKRYLVLFQNDAELRPTGGFWTAYALLKVEKGKVIPEKSDDIYDLDNKFTKKLEPPAPYAKYLNVKTWHLRDLNVSPDYRASVETFLPFYEAIPGESSVDGVIAINTEVLTNLVRVIGEVEVPGYGKFSANSDPRCDCPQIIYELENTVGRATPYIRSDRKAILGPMMQTILVGAYGAPKQVWPELFQSVWKNITEKDVLFYFKDEAAQAAVERVNLAGRMKSYEGDYLTIIDTNLGGAKTNLFVTQEVTQTIAPNENGTDKIVEVVYKNPYKGSNCNLEAGQLCLNGVMRDWVRFYVPLGSTLTDSSGFEPDTVKVSEDLGKTVIEGFLVFPPESQKRVSVSYRIPYTPQNEYKLMMQKQPGIKRIPVKIKLNEVETDVTLVTDQEISIAF